MFVKLAACAREKVQIGAALAGDGLHAGVWSTPPTPVLRVGGRVLLCTLTDPPREVELPSVVLPGTYKPKNDGECVYHRTRTIESYTPSRCASGKLHVLISILICLKKAKLS